MPLNVPALDASFERIVSQREAFAAAFYRELFARYPQARVPFVMRHTDMKAQQRALMQALEQTIAALKNNQTEQLAAILSELGQRHRDYGVLPEHYPLVGEVLLDTLADFDPAWSQQLRDDWAAAYMAVVSMMEPAGRPQGSPPEAFT
jgi:nitric oxide dioxygenase